MSLLLSIFYIFADQIFIIMIFLNGGNLNIFDLEGIARRNENVGLTSEIQEIVTSDHKFLKEFSASRILYGINTGFGPMAQYHIDDKQQTELQYNLIRSHSSGFGPFLNLHESKAVLVARLNSLLKGHSGVNFSMVQLMLEMCNRNIIPLIPSHGGVGASGDLVQLAHLALAMIGEGDVYYKNEVRKSDFAFKNENIAPLQISLREGIALLNGTSAMTGLAALNACKLSVALEWMIVFSTMINEIVEAFDDHFSEELNKVKNHKGQQDIARIARGILKDSKLIRKRLNHWNKESTRDYFKEKVQEYYSIRCIPQILGPIFDTLKGSIEVIDNELNSTSDNPITDIETQNVFHGGNFHGDYIALEMDKIKLIATKLSLLSERQLNFLLNPKINQKLPPFVNLAVPGLNFGLQGMQFTATSTAAENQTLSTSSYIHSISCNNDNQDIVSMGFNAARIARDVIQNTFEVIGIEAIAVIHAVEALNQETKLSSFNRKIFNELKSKFKLIRDDRPTYNDQKELVNYLQNNKPGIIAAFNTKINPVNIQDLNVLKNGFH